MRLLLLSLLLVSQFSLSCIALNIPINASQNSSSGLILSQQNAGNFKVNPASQFNGLESSVTHIFGLAELPLYSLYISKKINSWGFGIGTTYLDHDLYNESVSSLALSYSFTSILAGIAINYSSENAEGFPKLSVIHFDVGTIWELSHFTTALSIKNFSQNRLDNSYFPIYYLWETDLKYSEKSHLSIGLEKESNYDFSFKLSSLYQVHPIFSLNCGYQAQPNRLGLGTNFQIEKYQLSYSFRTHRQLDITHYVTLSYNY